MKNAMRLIEEQEKTPVVHNFTQNTKFLGKCPACNMWMCKGMDLCTVQSTTMGFKDWDKLFLDRPQEFRKEYTKDSGYPNTVRVHSECTLECSGCGEQCLLQQIAQYGLCLQCNLTASS